MPPLPVNPSFLPGKTTTMAAPSQEEAISAACRDLKNDLSQNTPPPTLSCSFTSIAMITQQPRLRLRVPRTLAMAMQMLLRRARSETGSRNGKNVVLEQKWLCPGRLFPKKAGSIISGTKKSRRQPCFPGVEGSKRVREDGVSSAEVTRDDEDGSCAGGVRPIACGTVMALPVPISAEDTWNYGNENSSKRSGGKASSCRQIPLSKPRGRTVLCFFDSISKNPGTKLLDRKDEGGVTDAARNKYTGSISGANIRQASARVAVRIRVKLRWVRQKMKVKTVCYKVCKPSIKEPKQEDNENENTGFDELCKKRILMGRRCKPPNRSCSP